MATAEKDTIYIDIDDEITSMVDKVQNSKSNVVALVLPKRATVLQSIVNMKLLKKASDHADKQLVLVTSEAGLLPLAGAAGVYVAKNLQSKPEIPSPPEEIEEEAPVVAAAAGAAAAKAKEKNEEPVDKNKSVGELATKKTVSPPEETIEVDNDTDDATVAGAAAKAAKPKKSKDKNKVPNFDKFRKRLFIVGGALIALIVFWFFATFVMPKASIVIKTDTSTTNAKVDFVASTSAQTVDTASATVPAKEVTADKADSQKAPATGQKDIGAKAAGTATMTAKNCTSLATPASVPAGTTLSSGNVSYVTGGTASFSFDSISGGCINFKAGSVNITAVNPGPASNISSTTLAVAGRSDVTATGSASGGTTQVVTVVNQTDVDNAKSKFTSNDDTAKAQLQKQLRDAGYVPVSDTFVVKNAAVVVSPDVGQQASEVTVTSKGTYSMLGVKQDDLKKLTDESVKTDINTNKQQVQDYGFDKATFKVGKATSSGVGVTMDSQLTIGPRINQDELKKQIAGKKKGDTEDAIKALPGVKDVEVHYSPFWVTSTPKKPTKITISTEKAN